jgi:uncharacterized membrane protein
VSSNSDGVNDWNEAFVWTEAGGMQGLGVLGVQTGGYRFSQANLMSSDGSVISGQSSNSDGVNDWNEAFVWTQGGGMQGLGVLAPWTGGGRESYAFAMASDGSVIAGRSTNSDGIEDWEEAIRWTQGGGMQGLGVLSPWAGGGRSSNAYVMSSDSNVIAGESSNSNGVDNWNEAFM